MSEKRDGREEAGRPSVALSKEMPGSNLSTQMRERLGLPVDPNELALFKAKLRGSEQKEYGGGFNVDDVDIAAEVDEDDLGSTEETAVEVDSPEDDASFEEDEGILGDGEEVASEVTALEDLPSDEDVMSEFEEDEPRSLAGLADDVVIDDDDDDDEDEDDAKDKKEDKKKKKKLEEGEWDGDHANLLTFVGGRKNQIPQHRGTLFGCQRAHSFLDNLLSTLSKAIRGDLKGQVDEGAADQVRVQLLSDMAALDKRIQYLSDKKFASDSEDCVACGSPLWKKADGECECLVCSGENVVVPGLSKSGNQDVDLKKEAGTQKINLLVSPLIHAIASTIINSKVSAGHDPEKVFFKLAEKYKLDDREKFEVVHVLQNMGYPLFMDRGRFGDGDYDQTDGQNVDWLTQYYA